MMPREVTRKNIVLVNDDGLRSPGLRALASSLARRHALTIVAPSSQKSWIGKASSYHRSLRFERVELDGLPAVLLDGTPADCAVAAVHHFSAGRPDFLVSGINVGANVGDSYILSSGTVGGAMEGMLAGIPSLACGVEFSNEATQQIEFEPSDGDLSRFAFAADYTARVVDALLGLAMPRPMLFNLNFAETASEKSRLVHAAVARYDYGCFLEERGGELYHRGSAKDPSRAGPATDMAAVRDGNISLSILDLLHESAASSDFAARLIAALGD
jgi:5'-nucleotidase